MNARKIMISLLAVLAAAAVIGAAFPLCAVLYWHSRMTNFEEGVIGQYDSFDGAYTMQVSIEEEPDRDIHYANIAIFDTASGEEVYAVRNAFRAFDFHWAVWETESDSFWLKTGDIGSFCYAFDHSRNTWVPYAVVQQDGTQYTLRAGMLGDEKTIAAAEVMRRLPEGYSIGRDTGGQKD